MWEERGTLHTKVYLKYEQHLFLIQNSSVRLQVTKRDCTAGKTLHYEFYFLPFVVFTIDIFESSFNDLK